MSKDRLLPKRYTVASSRLQCPRSIKIRDMIDEMSAKLVSIGGVDLSSEKCSQRNTMRVMESMAQYREPDYQKNHLRIVS